MTNQSQSHTPTPWTWRNVVRIEEQAEMQRVLAIINSHDALVAALREIDLLSTGYINMELVERINRFARAALAEVKHVAAAEKE